MEKSSEVSKIIAIAAMLVIVTALTGCSANQTVDNTAVGVSNSQQLTSTQQATQQQMTEEDKKILESLKKIILLPQDIEPTMALITDVEILKKNQPGFFDNAGNGQRLILYPNVAIIYDYEANKIIQVGPVHPVPTSNPSK